MKDMDANDKKIFKLLVKEVAKSMEGVNEFKYGEDDDEGYEGDDNENDKNEDDDEDHDKKQR
jgi:hypothetical protein